MLYCECSEYETKEYAVTGLFFQDSASPMGWTLNKVTVGERKRAHLLVSVESPSIYNTALSVVLWPPWTPTLRANVKPARVHHESSTVE